MIIDMLTRARRFHGGVTGVIEVDVTDVRRRLREERRSGRAISFTSCLVRASARVLERHPSLNRHVFTSFFGRQRVVQFDQIDCNLIVARRAPGASRRDSPLLLPVVLRAANTLTLEEIDAVIRFHKETPLADLPAMQNLSRLDRLPRFVLSLFSFFARSSPAAYLKTFGTYGLSSLVTLNGHNVGGAANANTGVGFIPGTIRKLPRYVGDVVMPREIMTVGILYDHFLVDGIEMSRASELFADLLEHPAGLFT